MTASNFIKNCLRLFGITYQILQSHAANQRERKIEVSEDRQLDQRNGLYSLLMVKLRNLICSQEVCPFLLDCESKTASLNLAQLSFLQDWYKYGKKKVILYYLNVL